MSGSPGASGVSSSASVGANVRVADGLVRRQAETASRSRGRLSPDAKKSKGLIYWGNFVHSTITIYSSKGVNGKEEGTITTGLDTPERLFVDSKGNVYASNSGNNTITAYKPGSTSPFLTISSGVDTPTGLTVDGAGTVYCANVANDTITVYPRGKTSASLTIDTPYSPEYLATDKSDNLYASVGQEVIEYPKGSTEGTNLNLAVSSPGGIEVDQKGNIIVIDGESTIDYIPAGKTQPSTKIPAYGAFALSLSENEKVLYASVESGANFIIESVAYPKGTSLSDKLTADTGDWPFAVSPDNALGK